MKKEKTKEEIKLRKAKSINALIAIVDFCLAIYLIYNIIAMF